MIRKPARSQALRIKDARREMVNMVNDHAKTLKTEFEDVVSDWSKENRPAFKIETKVGNEEIRATVRPVVRGKGWLIFKWTDLGTRAHPIDPKPSNRRGRLIFQAGYSPKTLPIARAHVGDGQAHGDWTSPEHVDHPGTQARKFSETIQKRTYPNFRKSIENAFRRIERRMNAK
jgi:hypothetical protein